MSVVLDENWNNLSEENAVGWGREVLIEGIFQWKRSGNGLVKRSWGENSRGGIKKILLCSAKQTVFFITVSLVESMVKSIIVIKSSRSFRNLSYSSVEFCMSLIRLFMMSSKVMRSEGIFLRIDFISVSMFPSLEKACSGSHDALEIGYPFHFT